MRSPQAVDYEAVPLAPLPEDEEDNVDHVPSSISSEHSAMDEKSGAIMGIHNAVMVFPQFIVSAVSALVFSVMEPGGSAGSGMDDMNMGGANVTVTTGMAMSDGQKLQRAEAGDSGALGVIFRCGHF
jgi:solute carrier family 45, member 1/2/4